MTTIGIVLLALGVAFDGPLSWIVFVIGACMILFGDIFDGRD